jgi:hypothetical protein
MQGAIAFPDGYIEDVSYSLVDGCSGVHHRLSERR